MPAYRTLLTSHAATDLDGFAAMVGLRHLYPDAALVLPANMEAVAREALADFPADLPVIPAAEVDLSKVERLVLADTHDMRRAGEWTAHLPAGVKIIVYDHHPRSAAAEVPGVEWHWGEVGSVCTIVTECLGAAGQRPSASEATLLLTGIYEDTGQLSFRTTVVRDFDAARQLVEWGADPAEAAHLLQRVWAFQQVAVFDELRETARVQPWGNLRAVVARATLPFFVPDISLLANHLDAGDADAVFILAAIPQKVFMIARGLSPGVDVAEVAVALGGGGHAVAASAILRGHTLVEAEAMLLRAMSEGTVRTVRARAIMSRPVIGVEIHATLREAHEKLSAHRIGSLIIREGERVVGALDADAVSAALRHGMADEAVAPYMRPAGPPVSTETTLNELRALLYRTGERFFLVEADEQLQGIVTRRDILRAVYEQALPEGGPRVREGGPLRYLAEEMRMQLGPEATGHLEQFGRLALQSGVKAFLVGGSVRDLILRRKPVDWDLVVEGDTAKLLEALRERGAQIKTYGRFQTAHVQFADGLAFDLAQARREVYTRPGALPDTLPGSLEQDLFRRDFTINAMAISLMPDGFGELHDRFRGLEDIKQRRVRVLHSLSFVDDPSRGFRALRLAVRFGFALEEQTARLLARAAALNLVRESEGTRLRRELVLAFEEREPLAVLREFAARGLLRACADYRLGAEEEGLVQRVLEWTHWYRLQFGHPVPQESTLRLLSLVAGSKPERIHKVLTACKLPAVEVESARQMRTDADALEQRAGLDGGEWALRPSAAVAHLENIEPPVLLLWAARYPQRRPMVTGFLTEWSGVQPTLRAADLMELGIPAGPEIGRWLRFVRDALLDGALLPDRQAELALVRKSRQL